MGFIVVRASRRRVKHKEEDEEEQRGERRIGKEVEEMIIIISGNKRICRVYQRRVLSAFLHSGFGTSYS